MNAIECTNLSKTFGRAHILSKLDLNVQRGSIFGLIGSNGAGKTTTIKILMNIINPTNGTASILGVNSRRLAPQQLQRIGYVSENQELPAWMTVRYLLDYLRPFYPNWDVARAERLAKQFDLPMDRKLKHLSRGMRVKAALVSALAYHPELLVLDEPFSGLDPLVREDLIEGLLEGAEEMTILISSHDLAEVETFASHIGYLENGRLQFAENMVDLLSRFREIELTLYEQRQTTPWPTNWIRPDRSPAVVRFVETQFDKQKTMADIHSVFGDVRHIDITPMPLRQIFLTLARNALRTA